jgi:S1-C subfamily serine protease
MTDPTKTPEPARATAGPFQAGSLCPGCQGAIQDGEPIATCPACSMAHHQRCWDQDGLCSSYHCDPRTRADAPSSRPEIVITADEAARVVPPPPRVAAPSAAVAKQWTPTRTSWSKPAVVSFVASSVVLAVSVTLALLSQGQVTAGRALVAIGCIFAAFIVGLAAAISAGTALFDRRMRGAPLALLALLFAVGSAVASIVSVAGVGGGDRTHTAPVDFTATPEPPSPETFENAPPAIANAMRANVYILGKGGPLGAMAWCGAGVILGVRDKAVYVLTNRHVCEGETSGAKELSSTFSTGETASSQVEWIAPNGLDLGIILCVPKQLPRAITRLRTTQLLVSDRVFAIGNPLRLSWTYTEGAVSRVHNRRSPDNERAMEVIQTQTPIQQGNSGGGLYDAQGKIVGINTWAIDPGEGRGPGFAISVKTIREVVPPRYLELTEEGGSDVESGGGPK